MEKRKRAARVDIQTARQALRIVRPIHQQLGLWQEQAARLAAQGMRVRKSATSEPRLIEEAVTLLHSIESHRDSLLAETRTVPQPVAADTRLVDTMRALDNAADATRRALGLLGGGMAT